MIFEKHKKGREERPRSSKRNLFIGGAGTLLPTFLLLFLFGCSSSSNVDNTAQTLRIGNGAEPATLDPHLATTVAEGHILDALFEGLIAPSPKGDLVIAPGMARSWSSNDEYTEFTFNLRENAYWSDGTDVTSRDFRDAYERLLNPKLGAGNAELLYDLKFGKAYNEGLVSDFSKVGVSTPDKHTLILTLERPTPYFLQKLKHWAWRPVHRLSIEANGGFYDLANRWARNVPIISNGPYVLESWRRNERIEAERNAGYWDAKSVSIKSIHFYPYENVQTEYRSFQAGQLDITEEVPSEQMDRAEHLRQDQTLATNYLLLNNQSPALSDRELRRALSGAINRKLLIRAIEKSGEPASRFTPGAMPDYPAPDFAAASQAAFSKPDGPLKFLVSNRETSIAHAEALQEMWRRTLGIEVRIQNMEFTSLLAALDAGDFDISYLAWHGDYLDPMAFLEIWRSDSRFNRAGWKNERFDKLLARSSNATSEAERFALLAEAETVLGEEMPIIPLIWKTKDYLISPRVEGWSPSLIDIRSYKHLKLSQ